MWLMWTEGLWAIALLIGGFSVVFPFVKMALLLRAWRGMQPGPGRTHLLLWMGRLGKWSMLDPFTVLVLVMLASDQWAVSATTFLGVYAFLTAVAITMVLSMVASVLDEHTIREREVAPRPPRRMLLRAAGWRGVIALLALASGIACFVGTLANPFLQINQFLLHGESYGIAGAAVTMVRERNWPLAALACFGLLLAAGRGVGVAHPRSTADASSTPTPDRLRRRVEHAGRDGAGAWAVPAGRPAIREDRHPDRPVAADRHGAVPVGGRVDRAACGAHGGAASRRELTSAAGRNEAFRAAARRTPDRVCLEDASGCDRNANRPRGTRRGHKVSCAPGAPHENRRRESRTSASRRAARTRGGEAAPAVALSNGSRSHDPTRSA
ncbi:MAG: hypothetical protein EBR71_02575 [Planctomycetes bacterium]|nr:hypothetical protein [Planctomycetota bacterium]